MFILRLSKANVPLLHAKGKTNPLDNFSAVKIFQYFHLRTYKNERPNFLSTFIVRASLAKDLYQSQDPLS